MKLCKIYEHVYARQAVPFCAAASAIQKQVKNLRLVGVVCGNMSFIRRRLSEGNEYIRVRYLLNGSLIYDVALKQSLGVLHSGVECVSFDV